MRVSDYIFSYLADYGVKHTFLVTGGGSMHLNDALQKEKRIKYICNHHEQGCAIAAEGYARTSDSLAVVNITSGPGGTNTLTGVLGQWTDSVPVLYLSGQVKYETTLSFVAGSNLRQLGDQEINIVDIVKPMVKYAAMVTGPNNIKIELQKAIHLATSGRPGPVWLDIPLNVQGALIDENILPSEPLNYQMPQPNNSTINQVLEQLQKAKRPLIVAGHGIKISKAKQPFLKLVAKIGVPVVSTFNGYDLMSTDSDNFIGRIGTLGSRGGNFALQNADLVIFIGTRNNIRQISYNWPCFAKKAFKIMVDIDEAELNKKNVKGDLLVHSDAQAFINKLLEATPKDYTVDKTWLDWCLVRKHKYPIVLEEYKTASENRVHPYPFIENLTKNLRDDAITVAGDGTACVVLFQAGVVKSNQRSFWNSGCAGMGYALPASIGAALASGKDVVCITGDGSIQMNLQELQTIKKNNLPVKIFVLNNQGYQSIRQTQSAYFKADYIGCNEQSGVSFPDFSKLAKLYDFKYFKIDSTTKMDQQINQALNEPNAVMAEVMLCEYSFAPKLSSEKLPDGTMISKPLEDLFPFLDRDEFKSNMIIND